MNIKALGFVKVKDAPFGSLIAMPNGTVILVSQYGSNQKNGNRDCYIVGSGEYYCGDYNEKGMLIELITEYENSEEDE